MVHFVLSQVHASFLIFLGKPYIEKNDVLEYRASTGEVIEIPCRVTGKPQPKVVWSVGGKPISSTGQEYEILVSFSFKCFPLLIKDFEFSN